jgi:hypothetical protein
MPAEIYKRKPQYDIDVELVTEALQEHPGSTIQELVSLTKRNYGAMQQATVRLNNRNLVTYNHKERPFRFFLKDHPQAGKS